MKKTIGNYQTVETLSATQLELVIKVYDGAISNFKQAKECYQKEKIQAGHDALEKAKKFIVHLYTTLDEEKGGDIAEKLSQLYAYAIEQIHFVQATKDCDRIQEVVDIFDNIREGWAELNKRSKNDNAVEKKNPHQDKPKKGISISL
ncbi:MAG: flagellar export chaperone FliS [Candidatus Zixiibacteriota bacterium]